MGRNAIASTRHMSRNSVSDVFHIADKLGISYQDIQSLDEDSVYRMFYPDKHAAENMYQDPEYEAVHRELKKVGVTLKLLWEEYKDRCRASGTIAMGYTKFCEGYSGYTVKNNLTSHIEHKPGMVTEVDWSGPTMNYVDTDTGELVTVYLFVAPLPYSQYSYVEPCLDMKMDTWIRCNVHMFEYFKGSTLRIVCDNLKTGVVSHPKEGEIILTDSYEAFGTHYLTAIMPARVRKPKDKPSVEGTVGKIATAVIARLRNETFYSFAALKKAVLEKLDEFNHHPFQKREYSRYEVWAQEEAGYLRSLPDMPYEISSWVYGRKINLNSHIVYQKNYYSCPYQHVGRTADLKVTDSSLEIYVDGKRVSTHSRFPEYMKNKYSTHMEDMPDRFQQPEWDDVRITRWAYAIGANTGEVIDRIFASVKVKEQGYNPSLSVLRLSKTYSEARLETACEMALTHVRTPRYHHLKAILAANQDQTYLEQKKASEKNFRQRLCPWCGLLWGWKRWSMMKQNGNCVN